MKKKIELTPEVRQMYLYVEQELNNILRAIEPLKKNIEYMREIGQLDPLKGTFTSSN